MTLLHLDEQPIALYPFLTIVKKCVGNYTHLNPILSFKFQQRSSNSMPKFPSP